jgi:hypothetical protein
MAFTATITPYIHTEDTWASKNADKECGVPVDPEFANQ